MHYLCLRSCIDVNRPTAVYLHCHHEPQGEWWERIKPVVHLRHIEPNSLVTSFAYRDKSLAPFRYAHLADFARLQILLEVGGIYADMDTLFIRPIPDEWWSADFILGRERPPAPAEGGGSLCNAWIAAKPGAEFGRIWLAEMETAFDGGWSTHSTLLPYQLSKSFPKLLRVEPETSFYAIDWSSERINELFLGVTPIPSEARSLHLWSHLWFDPKRLDFSCFNGELLTPDYVAFGETTYARLARPYLPADISLSRFAFAAQRVKLLSIQSKLAARRMLRLR